MRACAGVSWADSAGGLENITENVYLGNQRSMTITNCLFRLGGAAALLSNKRRHWWTARSACFDAHVLVLT